ncbi:MAG: sulfurtransferase TusA family protein [Sedimentisphaerales bacterium]|nr:sulfurtransferase TusA family protein [Sedimentisphaerales bacterium]
MNADTQATPEQRTADLSLDCRELRCPLPIVKISQAMKEMASGQTLWVEADDPAFESDLEAWVRATGHELLQFSESPTQRALLRKAPPAGWS